jgi:hypothetical protein
MEKEREDRKKQDLFSVADYRAMIANIYKGNQTWRNELI